MDKMSTKQRILYAALDMFSEKGYDGVSVDQIAEAVGIKGPSLYHHYKSKEDILNALIGLFESYYYDAFGDASAIDRFPASADELIDESMRKISFTVHDPQIRKVRKLLAMEQFRSPRLSALTTKHHLTGIEKMYSLIFERMMQDGSLKENDPKLLALEFVAPVTVLLHICDREPEREDEILKRIDKHLRHFAQIYGTNNK